MRYRHPLLLTFLSTLLLHLNLKAQDSLTFAQLEPLTYSFNIENGKMTGEGATFLTEELSKAQFTMLGEYHGSKRISEFTEALIPLLDQAQYKTMVLEVGPITGELLNTMDVETEEALKEVHEKYMLKEEDGYVNTPFPFFDHTEDAAFLTAAKKRGWQILGIDQEFYHSTVMLADKMYENLSDNLKGQHKALHQEVVDSLNLYYVNDLKEIRKFSIVVQHSPLIKTFLDKMSATQSENAAIAEAFRASINIYYLYATRQWFENNQTRIKYMKKQLREGLAKKNFNIHEDKLLIKMGGYHLSKGFSPLGLYEVGNTLNELAEFNGHTSLNIAFSNRFYMENDTLVDVLVSGNKYQKRYKDFDQMGKKEEWVVIDLRPMVKGHYYRPVKYKFNKYIESFVKRYDLVVIPKTEMDPTPVYKTD
ncbi:MAG: hypothetical protein AAGG75_10840 [Bacteroidota bacterium]